MAAVRAFRHLCLVMLEQQQIMKCLITELHLICSIVLFVCVGGIDFEEFQVALELDTWAELKVNVTQHIWNDDCY